MLSSLKPAREWRVRQPFNVDVNRGAVFRISNAFTDDGASQLAVVDDNAVSLNIFTSLPPAINGADE